MTKSNMKALEENSMLRREIKMLKERIAVLEARNAELMSEREIHADGNLHT